MPATEKTWRDQARMHVIFGITALVMLAGTIWMLAKDHNREWRATQLADRAKEKWTIEAQFAQAEADTSHELASLNQQLNAEQASPVTDQVITEFQGRVQEQDAELKKEGISEEAGNFKRLDDAKKNLDAAIGEMSTAASEMAAAIAEKEQAAKSDEKDADKKAAAIAEKAKAVEEKSKALAKKTDDATDARNNVFAAMNEFVQEAKRRENEWLTKKKLEAANQTAAISKRGIAVGESKPTADWDAEIQQHADQLVQLDAYLADAKDYRLALENTVKGIQANELDLQKRIAAIQTDLKRLKEKIPSRLASTGEWVNRAPVLDALYTGDIKLDQIWLPDMKINYNFSSVARYDRCIVCHRAIDKTAPGSATEPAYPPVPRAERERVVQLRTPEKSPFDLQPAPKANAPDANSAEAPKDGDAAITVVPPDQEPTITSVYGLVVTTGQIDPNEITVQVVAPQSLAAMSGLQMGDVIVQIEGGKIYSPEDVSHYLLELANWGKPIAITIRRGLNQPFTSHPRLDLFVGSTSPHKKGDIGCTICHDGQGSATDFKWASHTPNDPKQALEWSRTHGWFDNHHWIFPMTPERFIESNCLKCHHEVVELEPSERFPQPPAPKLVHGYELVRQYGCYGCHEVPGYDGPTKRTGPDLRTEPNFAEVAKQIESDPGLTPEERSLAQSLAERPSANDVRNELLKSIRKDAELAKPQPADAKAAAADAKPPEKPRLTPETHALIDALKDVDAPGSMRRVGPSLRHLASKVDYDWLYNWIRRPADFRPTTRMPQFFLQHEHLDGEHKDFTIHDADGNALTVSDQEYTKRFENIEIHALAQFLLDSSQPFEYLNQPAGITEAPSHDRGKWQFESRGCLACHSHREFPNIHSTQGPDLSRVAAKFTGEKGQRWLYSWVKAPNRYHARTVMPNTFLDPIVEADSSGKPTGKVADPAADVMAFLLSVPPDWKPETPAPSQELTADERAALNDLTTVWLSASFPRRRAEKFANGGIPSGMGSAVKVDEQVLVGPYKDEQDKTKRQLQYVARRSIGRYGCFGCHDIPGYETAKPIGTPLASWGRKDPSQLAFENIGEFLATHGINGTDKPKKEHEGGEHGLDPQKFPPDDGYFVQSLNSHQRHGFLWQKLRMPRSFDFETTRVKRYDERLRMPRFPFTAEEREAVMTFVLGLTNEAPADKFIFKPNLRQKAIVQGRHVLDKYNCAGCHVLNTERWNVAFAPDAFEPPGAVTDFPFIVPDFTPDQVKASVTPDRRGLLRADLHGMPVRDEATGQPRLVDQDGVPIEPDDKESKRFYELQLFRHAMVAGSPRLVGTSDAILRFEADPHSPGPLDGQAFPTVGGDLAKYLYSRAIAEEKKLNPSAIPTEAWGWLPPPLHHEGEKVQTEWLHDFLMDPTRIRPAAILRMPNFHMSSDEAAALVDYFAAISSAEFPYEYNERRRGGYLSNLEQSHPQLLDDAMKIVTDSNYCVKCHSIGDYEVQGSIRTQGPKLDEVYRRLRADYTRHWIANPQRILPYTGMPINIPYNPTEPNMGGVNQALFPGTSMAQLDGVVDLLMNFDTYTKRRTSIKELVKEPAQQPPAAAPPAASDSPPRDTAAGR